MISRTWAGGWPGRKRFGQDKTRHGIWRTGAQCWFQLVHWSSLKIQSLQSRPRCLTVCLGIYQLRTRDSILTFSEGKVKKVQNPKQEVSIPNRPPKTQSRGEGEKWLVALHLRRHVAAQTVCGMIREIGTDTWAARRRQRHGNDRPGWAGLAGLDLGKSFNEQSTGDFFNIY